jgi:hypothetical protein
MGMRFKRSYKGTLLSQYVSTYNASKCVHLVSDKALEIFDKISLSWSILHLTGDYL